MKKLKEAIRQAHAIAITNDVTLVVYSLAGRFKIINLEMADNIEIYGIPLRYIYSNGNIEKIKRYNVTNL